MYGWFQLRWVNVVYIVSCLAFACWLFFGYHESLLSEVYFSTANTTSDGGQEPQESPTSSLNSPQSTPPLRSTAMPHTSLVFANPYEAYPPNDLIYPNQRISASHPRLRYLIYRWVRLADTLGWRYVAVAGTLLAALRNGRIIPWDSDLDIAIDRETGEMIRDLAAGQPQATSSGQLWSSIDGVSIEWNTAVAHHQPWLDGEVRLIVNEHRAMDLPGDGLRYNRTGDVVPSQEDSVSFVGPYGTDATEVGPQRASFPREVVPCPLEGQVMWCPSAADYEPMLQHAYGKDYMAPSQ
ncbi:uncharacterized protein ACA1_050750 [Acanthamoeba castellanii str. Neff]|uniref:LicD/FKTN/FKRP nucleotidyltransferase domain-containing protein n=1 Tax=Acanthamoeba castellanii (strain ATCC 30010 / Neff) TaxID=1257118 RepID=L8GI18_ACACF|nr:uncharacterized protein ACA1_050750 [Acanthamoeba castellanii str. Neff]ELR12504.1 hypothetical protein ACA1_050750 [Acanthamoeba castellanii str. Neff]